MIAIRILDRPRLGTLQLDCTTSEDHELGSEVTDSPVELGADVTDHIRLTPDRVTIEGVVSNHVDSLIGQLRQTGTEHVDAWQTLREIRRRRALFDITTSLRKYRNMWIESVSTRRSLETTNILIFTASCREIKFASVELLTTLADDVEGLGAGADNLGTQGMVSFEDL